MTPAATGELASLERRMTSALKELGGRIGPLEASAEAQKTRHEVVVGKLDGLSGQVAKLGDKSEMINSRCDDLNTRLTVVEVAWAEQMKPGLDRLRNLELKVAGAAVVGGATITGLVELIRALVA